MADFTCPNLEQSDSTLNGTQYQLGHVRVYLIDGGLGEGSVGKADALVGSVKDRVKAFEETKPVDEVKAFATWGTDVVDDEVDAATKSTDLSVEGAGPQLGIGGELESGLLKEK